MLLNTNTNRKVPERSNIKRFGEMYGIKQNALVVELKSACHKSSEETRNQLKLSLFEQAKAIGMSLMKKIPAVLKNLVEAIKNFDAEQAIKIISNTANNNDITSAVSYLAINLHLILLIK